MNKLTIPEGIENERLDVFLAHEFDISRSRIQKVMKNGGVLFDGKPAKPNQAIYTGNIIEIPETFEEPKTEKGELPELTILYEDDDVLVIEKPAGLLVHQANEADRVVTLVDVLRNKYPNIHLVGDDEARPGIVHRLDKNVSGVMIVAKTQKAFDHLKDQFKTRMVEKEYVALVYGQLSKDLGTIRLKIARSKKKGHMVSRPEDGEGKEAVTHYEVLERYKTTTLVKVNIETGRTHQIRVHFHANDHSVVGDPLYKKHQMKNIRPIKLDRIFLHARRLTITLPNGERKTFESDLPKQLADILKNLQPA